MHLKTPPEPSELKSRAKSLRKQYPDINSDSLHVWFKQQLPKYLWDYWKDDLKSSGFTWQKFLKALSLNNGSIIAWLRDELSWKELVENLKETLIKYKSWL